MADGEAPSKKADSRIQVYIDDKSLQSATVGEEIDNLQDNSISALTDCASECQYDICMIFQYICNRASILLAVSPEVTKKIEEDEKSVKNLGFFVRPHQKIYPFPCFVYIAESQQQKLQ